MMRNKKKDGFTLMELVLSISLMGILAVAAIAVVFNHKGSYLEVAGKKARSDIEHARGLAMMKKGTTFGVFFDQANNRYTVYEGSVGNPVPDPLTKGNLIESFTKWPGVSVTSNYTVEFGPFGNPTTGGGGSVDLTDGTDSKTISVTAGTGKVSLQ